MNLKSKLTLSFVSVLLVFSLVLFAFMYYEFGSLINDNIGERLTTTSQLGVSLINASFPGDWRVEGDKLYKGESLINGNTQLVDEIKNSTGFMATLFLNDTRVSTNVLDNGQRIEGTKASAEVMEAVLKNGKDYTGRTIVGGREAITYYSPIRDASGNTVGMWFVGMYQEDVTAKLGGITRFVILIFAGIMVIGSGLSYLLGHFLTRTIKEAAKHLKKISEGDFSLKLSDRILELKGEMGEISRAANEMHLAIVGMVTSIRKESATIDEAMSLSTRSLSELNAGIEDVSATTQELSAGMEQTAAAMEEMNATSSEIEANVERMAQKAQEGSRSAREISERADNLKQNAQKAIKSSREIYTKTREELQSAILQSQAIEKIQKLSDAVLDITAQTNLLSLNAAIEAARAGEAGRGFAVVADEIRKLAEDSKTAVGEIQEVTLAALEAVKNLVEGSEKVLSFMDKNVIRDYEVLVDTGEKYSQDARFIDNLVSDFSNTSEQLLLSINSMLRAIQEVTLSTNEGAQGTSAIAGKNTDIADRSSHVIELTAKAKAGSDALKDYVNRFVV